MRATLGEVLTEEAFTRMIALAERWTAGVEAGDRRVGPAVARHSARLPRRVPLQPGPARETERRRTRPSDVALERYMHLYALNRGILLTPFHNMALMSPATTEADVDLHTEVFREAVLELGDRLERRQDLGVRVVLGGVTRLVSRRRLALSQRRHIDDARGDAFERPPLVPERAVAPHRLEVAQRDHDPAVGPANEVGQSRRTPSRS